MSERRLPPVTGVGMTSLALIVAGGIYLAAHLPDRVPLGPAIALLCASALLLVGNLVALALVPGFAWGKFFQVAKWALLAYAITAGLIEYALLTAALGLSAIAVWPQIETAIGAAYQRLDTNSQSLWIPPDPSGGG